MTSDSESGFMRLQIREGIKPGTEGNETGSNLVLLSVWCKEAERGGDKFQCFVSVSTVLCC